MTNPTNTRKAAIKAALAIQGPHHYIAQNPMTLETAELREANFESWLHSTSVPLMVQTIEAAYEVMHQAHRAMVPVWIEDATNTLAETITDTPERELRAVLALLSHQHVELDSEGALRDFASYVRDRLPAEMLLAHAMETFDRIWESQQAVYTEESKKRFIKELIARHYG